MRFAIINSVKLPYSFGRYQLEEKIAQGGMAEVFRARYSGASGFSKTVCVKRLLPIWSRETHFIQSLIDEAKLLAYLNHPNIVQVFE
ncbi:MAG: protein kinase, partial [Deltaproteobacteria bacterium]|nr:protein kinase [Deltaproteobacteria bacterium]